MHTNPLPDEREDLKFAKRVGQLQSQGLLTMQESIDMIHNYMNRRNRCLITGKRYEQSHKDPDGKR